MTIKNLLIRREVMSKSRLRIYVKWISTNTMSYYLSIFSPYGKNVINTLSQYLDNIALTNYNKALLIGRLLDEDPLLICSLGLQPVGYTMPIRFLKGDRIAYIDTGFAPNNYTKIRCVYKVNVAGGDTMIVYGVSDGSPSATNPYGMLKIYTSPNRYGFGYSGGCTLEVDPSIGSVKDVVYDLVQDKNVLYIDNVEILTMPTSGSWQCTRTLWLWGRNSPGSTFLSTDSKVVFEIWDDDVKVREMYPFKRNNVYGMIDVVNNVFYTNAASGGAFNQEFTLNGAHWVPNS